MLICRFIQFASQSVDIQFTSWILDTAISDRGAYATFAFDNAVLCPRGWWMLYAVCCVGNAAYSLASFPALLSSSAPLVEWTRVITLFPPLEMYDHIIILFVNLHRNTTNTPWLRAQILCLGLINIWYVCYF